ncbi:hypothetical protein LTS18_000593, partial [Coniosporium uncinatum]
MSYNHTVRTLAPLLLRGGARNLRRTPHGLPHEISAIALLVPRRALATETSTHAGSNNSGPPPGFNVEEAKKPLPKEDQQKSQQAKPASTPQSLKDVAIPKDEPTSHAKSQA